MNIVFAGTPEFAVSSLKALVQSDHKVVAVYTQPDRPAGRGRRLAASPVKRFAEEHEIPVFQPESLKDTEELSRLSAFGPDVMIVVAYGLLLPQVVLDVPRLGCLNVHASLLPRWRGAAPIQRAIEAGDVVTGITIMQMEAGLDTGPMLVQAETAITPDDTAASLHDRLAEMGAKYMLDALQQLEAGTASASPQDDALATYAHKLTKAEATIDWSTTAEQIRRKVCAFNPWPAANSAWKGKRLRLLQATTASGCADQGAGTVCAIDDDGISVATADGCLVIRQLQLEGGRVQSSKEFINGHPIRVGDSLGT